MPKAPPPSGSQGIASGDPLGQAPAAPPEQPTVAISSGDPLAAKRAPAKPDAKPAEPPLAEQAPAGGDETGVVPPSEEGDAGANGADESRPAKARAAGAQDEPE
jgi:hypothetical protein